MTKPRKNAAANKVKSPFAIAKIDKALAEKVADLQARVAHLELDNKEKAGKSTADLATIASLEKEVTELKKENTKLKETNNIPDAFGKNSTYQRDTDISLETKEERENFLRSLQRALREMKPNLIWFFSLIFPLLVRGGSAFTVASLQFIAPRRAGLYCGIFSYRSHCGRKSKANDYNRSAR